MVIGNKEEQSNESLISPFGKSSLIVVSFLSLFLSLFFLSFNLTGYSIFDIDRTDYSITGSMLFILSLVGFFMYFRLRKA